jgi:hypothetical protein
MSLSPHLLHLIGSGVHSLGHKKGGRVILLILCLFIRFMEMEKDPASFACKWLIFYRTLLKEIRFRAENNPRTSPVQYGKKTSTTTLRKHLFTAHIDKWISECKKHGIAITAKGAMEAIAAHQGIRPDTYTQPRLQFILACFMDYLVEFIVATDQV